MSTLHPSVATPGWDPTPTLSSGLAVVAATGVFWWLGGLSGLVLGTGIGLCLFVFPVVFVFALAQVVLAVSLPVEAAPTVVLVAELPLLGLLGTTVDRRHPWRRAGRSLLVGGTVLAASVAVVVTVQAVWRGSLLVFGIVAITVYGLHRYAVVVFAEGRDE